MERDFTGCQEELWHGFHLLYGRRDPARRAGRSLESMDHKEREELLKLERELRAIYELELARRACGKVQLPNGTLQEFADKFGMGLPRAKKLYQKFKRIGTVRDTRGHPEECRLTFQQQKELIGLYLIKTYYIYLADGTSQKPPTYQATVTATFVTSALIQSFPELQTLNWFTPEYVKRYLRKKEQDNPGPFMVARRGDKELYNLFVPSLPNNDATFPFERVQADGRYLPIYISHKGMTCTVVLILFLDDFSGYIASWMLRPRKELDGMGEPYKIDFTAADIMLLFVELLRSTGFRPKIIYTDNGSQFVALNKVLHFLVADEEIPTLLVHTKPGKPQGRGKVEDALKRVGALLSKHGGYVEDEKDLMNWRRAREHSDLLGLTKLRTEVDKIIHKLNTTPHIGETLSPYDKWRLSPGPRYSAPPPNRFIHLLENAEESYQTISKKGVQYNKGTNHSRPMFYVPRDASEAADMRWAKAVGRGEQVRFQIHKMQEFGTFYYAQLDGEHWEEIIPNSNHGRSLDQRMHNRHTTLNVLRQEVSEIRKETIAAQIEHHGMMPQHDPIYEEAVYKEPLVAPKFEPQQSKTETEDVPESNPSQADDSIQHTATPSDQTEITHFDQPAEREQESALSIPIDPAEAQALEDMFEQLKRKYAPQ